MAHLLGAVQAAQPVPMAMVFQGENYRLLSGSMERFLGVSGQTVRSRPIKGTLPRGGDGQSDAELARQLRASPKECAENTMIVDMVRNDLRRACQMGSVQVTELLTAVPYATLWHLESEVQATLQQPNNHADLLAATLPPHVGNRLPQDPSHQSHSKVGAQSPRALLRRARHRLARWPRGVVGRHSPSYFVARPRGCAQWRRYRGRFTARGRMGRGLPKNAVRAWRFGLVGGFAKMSELQTPHERLELGDRTGQGVFETMIWRKNPPQLWPLHMLRMQRRAGFGAAAGRGIRTCCQNSAIYGQNCPTAAFAH